MQLDAFYMTLGVLNGCADVVLGKSSVPSTDLAKEEEKRISLVPYKEAFGRFCQGGVEGTVLFGLIASGTSPMQAYAIATLAKMGVSTLVNAQPLDPKTALWMTSKKVFSATALFLLTFAYHNSREVLAAAAGTYSEAVATGEQVAGYVMNTARALYDAPQMISHLTALHL